MIPESRFYWAILVVFIILAGLIAVQRVRRRQALATEYYGNEPARLDRYQSRDDETIDTIHRWAEETRRDSGKYDTRTLAALASECPACKGDHEGSCELLDAYERDLEDSGILTGTIVAVDDMPEQEVTASFLTPGPLLDNLLHHWHEDSDGNWSAPLLLLDSLDEDDWLRQLLEEPVLALAGAV